MICQQRKTHVKPLSEIQTKLQTVTCWLSLFDEIYTKMKDYEITIKIQVQASDSIIQDDVLRQLLSGKDYLQEQKDFQFFATPKAVADEGAFAEYGTQIKTYFVVIDR